MIVVFFIIIFLLTISEGFSQDSLFSVGNTNFAVLDTIEKFSQDQLHQNLPDNLTFLFIVFVFFTTIFLLFYKDYLPLMIQASYDKNAFRRFYQNRNSLLITIVNLGSNFYIISLSLVFTLHIFYKKIPLDYGYFTIFLMITTGLFLWKYLKYIFVKIFGFVFEADELFYLIMLRRKVSDTSFIVFFNFFVFALAFVSIDKILMLKIAYLLVLLNYLNKFFSSILLSKEKEFSLFVLILYFCTTEILPVIIVIKLIINYLGVKNIFLWL